MSWTQLGLDIDGEAAVDNAGNSVSISADGNTVAIGAPFNDGSGSASGHVRVYRFIAGVWTQLGSDINGQNPNDYSGWSVSLSADGNTVAIGAEGSDAAGTDSGQVRVYRYIAGVWTKLGNDINGEAGDDIAGHSVSISADGNTVAIGAPYNDAGGNDKGHVRVYQYDSISLWVQLGGTITGDINGELNFDNSGWSVSLSADGSTVAIGAPFNGGTSGHVRVYYYNGASWNQVGGDIDSEAVGDRSGYSVSLSSDGQTVAIGATFNDNNGSNSGHVRVYEYTGVWTQLGGNIAGEAANDNSGWSVSLSADGSTVAIGATRNDGNGSNSGHVRVYAYDGVSSWNQVGADIDGEAADDQSGTSVSLSADGSTVAIGAPYNDGNGGNSGHTRVYRFIVPTTQPSPSGAPGYEGLLSSLSIISALLDCDTNGLVANNVALTILNQLFQSGVNGNVMWYNIGGTADGGPATIENPYLLDPYGNILTASGFNCFKDLKYYFYGKCYVQQSTTFTIDTTNPCVSEAYSCLGISVNSSFSSVCARFAGWLSGQTKAQGKYIYESTLDKVLTIFKGFCEVIKQRVLAERVYVKGKRTISDCVL